MPTNRTATRPSIWLSLLGSETRYYDAGGVRTRAIEAGSGEPLMLLHGAGGHAEAFAHNVVPLGEHFRTLAIDYLGHGLTGSIDGPLTKEAYVKHLIDFMDAAGIQRANLLGESLGGWIAVWTSLLHPQRVGKLIYAVGAKLAVPVDDEAKKRTISGRAAVSRLSQQLLEDPSWDNVRARLGWLFHAPDKDLTDELVDLRYTLYRRKEISGSRGHQTLPSGEDGRQKGDDQLTPERLRQIKHPTLVLWTEHNPSAGVAEAREAMKYLPNAEMTVMEDCAHWGQWEHPEAFNEIVREYLQR